MSTQDLTSSIFCIHNRAEACTNGHVLSCVVLTSCAKINMLNIINCKQGLIFQTGYVPKASA